MKKQNKITRKEEAGFNISWSSILAGVVTFISMLLVFSLIGMAIGFGSVEPTSANPLDGVTTGLLIWTVLSFVLSLGAAGFVAGITSRRLGLVHGFLTWATSVIVLVSMMSFLTIGAFNTIGSTLGSVFSMAGQGVETVASSSSELISKGFDEMVGQVEQIDTQELQTQTAEILKDTDIPELQPNYINSQLEESSTEIKEAGKQILLNPEDTDKILQETIDSLEEKTKTISDAVDKEAIANAVNKNTELTQEEAEEATDNIYLALQNASLEAEKELQIASQRIEIAKVEIDQTIEEARIKADEISDATAKASIWGFVALILGMIITSFAGLWSSRLVVDIDEELF